MLESVYECLLEVELRKRGHEVRRQVSVSFVYEGVCFENAFRLDLLVDETVVVELKSTAIMHTVFPKQVRTYLVLTGLQVGLLVNFGMATLKEGFVRVVNGSLPDLKAGSNPPVRSVCDLDLTNLHLTEDQSVTPESSTPSFSAAPVLRASASLRESSSIST